MLVNQDVTQRFMNKVVVAESGCWHWSSVLHRDGYGKFYFLGAQRQAHRVSYELFVGETKGKWVLHKCDNRKCVNPEHLYLGGAKRNALDRSERKRYRVMVPFSTVQEIRSLYATGQFTQEQIASRFGVKQPMVSKYVLNKQRLSY